MAALIDTSVFVAIETNESAAPWCRAALNEQPAVFLNPIVLSELLLGVELATSVAQALSRRATYDWASTLACLNVEAETAAVHARMAAALKRRGTKRARQSDLWIAASALQHGLTVLTCNGRDYADIDGITVLSP